MSYDLSVCLPAIRPHYWKNLYESLKKACSKYTFELVIISPYDLPEELNGIDNIKFIKDFGSGCRATMLGSEFCTGKYIAVPADDGYFFPGSFDAAIDKMESSSPKDIVILRYREGKNISGKTFDDSYWLARSHLPPHLHIHKHWKTASQPLMRLDFFREIGGWDCNFEHVAFAAHDLSYRAQRSGSVLHLSPLEVMNADHIHGTSGDHAPVHNGHLQNDQPLFFSMYSSPSVNSRVNIDFNNWMNSSPSWSRRWPDRTRYDLSICVSSYRPHLWKQWYDSMLGSSLRHRVQVIFVGPYGPLDDMKNNPDIKFLKDFGAPTRCVQIGSMLCESNLFMWISDDCDFRRKSLTQAIELFNSEDNSKNEMIIRYSESPGRQGIGGGESDIDYYRLKHHKDNRLLNIPEESLTAPIGMLTLSHFRSLGGFDCRYEHINLSTHDLSLRIQKLGGRLFKSNNCVADFDWDPTKPDYAPVFEAYNVNDLPLFLDEYTKPNNKTKIDFANWRQSPEKWRRFK